MGIKCIVWKLMAKHDYLSLPSWKDREMHTPALRQWEAWNPEDTDAGSHGFVAKLSGLCSSHQAIQDPLSGCQPRGCPTCYYVQGF
jgi:hypothetical protein